MDLFKRIGTQKKKFKLQFFIGRVKFSSFCAGKIYVVIRRGKHKAKSEQKLEMSEDFKINFNKEILQLEVTLFFDEKQNKYQQKPGQINIVLLSKQSKSLLGIVPFDVAEYANCGQESIKQKKNIEQMPRKLQGLIEYNVFIKYIGEGGSQSSLDKISDFFFGKTKEPQSNSRSNLPLDGPGASIRDKDKGRGSGQSQNEDPMTKTQVKKDKKQILYRSNTYVTGEKPISGKQIGSGNLSISKNFYFDEPEEYNGQRKRRKKDKTRSNSVQKIQNPSQADVEEAMHGKMNQTSWDRNNKSNQIQDSKQFEQKQPNSEKNQYKRESILFHDENRRDISQLQRKIQQQIQEKQSHRSRLQQSQLVVYQLQNQLSHFKKQNESLKQQLQEYKEQIRLKQNQLSNQVRMPSIKLQNLEGAELIKKLQQFQHQLRKIQKQKNELIVENSRLKEKYKQDIKKYEQILSEKEQKNSDLNEAGKLALLRMKEQCSKYRQTIDRMTKQKNERALELNRQRNQNKILHDQITTLKDTLSKIKMKIADKINQAVVLNDESMINMLMELNRQEE